MPMPRRNLHDKPFDESTKDKLDLYRDYLREWLPVFIHASFVETLQVFDFFAGPGIDLAGNPGSPVIACDEIRSVLLASRDQHPKIKVFFNEYEADKYKGLSACIDKQGDSLPRVEFDIKQKDFHSAFWQWEPLMHRKTANLLFLDQSGVQHITKPILQTIMQLPRTDFIFFISSAMVNRFKNLPEIRTHVPIADEDLSQMNGSNVHRIVANAYRRWIPDKLEYYLGSFSIKKGANVYGLIFGSHHPRGIDKFLKVAWKRGGEANFDIDKDGIDPNQPSLFPEYDIPQKISRFEKELESAVLERRVSTNKEVYTFALRNGVLPKHAKDALNQMMTDGKLPQQSFYVSYDAWKKSSVETIQYF
jgi:three-Cys-motif partner protein